MIHDYVYLLPFLAYIKSLPDSKLEPGFRMKPVHLSFKEGCPRLESPEPMFHIHPPSLGLLALEIHVPRTFPCEPYEHYQKQQEERGGEYSPRFRELLFSTVLHRAIIHSPQKPMLFNPKHKRRIELIWAIISILVILGLLLAYLPMILG